MIKKLIIGKNSQLVKMIMDDLINCDFVSHNQIDSIQIDSYSEIYLFSWCKNSLIANIRILRKLKNTNTYFISSVAAIGSSFSNFKFSYPKNKYYCERYCLKNGIGVLRIGSITETTHPINDIGITSLKVLKNFINKEKLNTKNVYNLFEVSDFKRNLLKKIIFTYYLCFNSFICKFPNIFVIFSIIFKLLRIKLYGYSLISNRYMSNKLQVGFGCIGSSIYKIHNPSLIVYSGKTDYSLFKDGFNGLIIGKSKIGAAKYWHGVWTKTSSHCSKLRHKYVPYIVSRRNPPLFKSISFNIDLLKRNLFTWELIDNSKSYSIFTNKLVLCAGVIENLRLLSNIQKIDKYLSDDDVIYIGTISKNDALKSPLLSAFIFLINFNYSYQENYKGNEFIYEIRPFCDDKIKNFSNHFYTNSTSKIIYKLIKNFNLNKLNEAFFNKFGIGIATKRYSIYLQIRRKKNIHIVAENGIIKKLLKNKIEIATIDIINEYFSNIFASYVKNIIVDVVDGQHICYDDNFDDLGVINKLVTNGELFIYPRLTTKLLDSSHSTKFLIDDSLR